MPAFIDDGYSETKDIPAGPGYEAVSVSVRPLATIELAEFRMKLRLAGENETEQAKVISEVVAAHLVAWNLKNSKGEAVAVSSANVGKLSSDFGLQLYYQINPPADATEIALLEIGTLLRAGKFKEAIKTIDALSDPKAKASQREGDLKNLPTG